MKKGTIAINHGVEQELQLVDARGVLVNRIDEFLQRVPDSFKSGNFPVIDREHYDCQVEIRTGICRSLSEIRHLLTVRRQALQSARLIDLRLIAMGVNPVVGTKERMNFGEHHHIQVQSTQESIAIHNLLRLCLPEFHALLAFSPVSGSRVSHYLSLRSHRSPHIGLPQHADRQFEETLRKAATIPRIQGRDARHFDINCFANFKKTEDQRSYYPTIELRLVDAHPSMDRTIATAALLQVLVKRARKLLAEGGLDAIPRIDDDILRANRQAAIRSGLGADFKRGQSSREVFSIHSGAVDRVSARHAVSKLLDELKSEIDSTPEAARSLQPFIRLANGVDEQPAMRLVKDFRRGGISSVIASLFREIEKND